MIEMISAYLEQTPPLVLSLKQSFKNKDWVLLKAVVHKMIPSFSIMGMNPDFENMAKEVQEFALNQQHKTGMANKLLQLGNVCTQACTELEIELNLIKDIKNYRQN